MARFIEETSLEAIPRQVSDKAKALILNILGSALAGSTEKTGRIGIDLAKETGGFPHCTVIGGGFKVSPLLAALANGISAHATDQDDTDSRTQAHPTAAVVPAVLAAGEYVHASGKKVLESYILGVEAECKVGWGISPMHLEMGFHATGTLGHVGATVGACKVMGLSASEIETALGIMGSLSSGIRHNVGSMTKPLHAGNAAHNGVLAAMLAKKAFTSVENVLENHQGFADVFGGKNADPGRMVGDLGKPYMIESPGLIIKANPCGTYASVIVQALQEMMKKFHFTPEAIQKIKIVLNPTVHAIMHFVYPKDMLEAKYSIPFIAAVTLRDGEATLKQFTDEKTKDPIIRDLISKIDIQHYPSPSKNEDLRNISGADLSLTHLTIELRGGKRYSRTVDSAKGYADQPITGKELRERFRTFADLVLPKPSISKTIRMVESLEKLRDIGELMEEIGKAPAKGK